MTYRLKLFNIYYPGDNPVTGEKNPTHYTIFGVEMWRYKFSRVWKGEPHLPPRFDKKPWQQMFVRFGDYVYCFSWSYWRHG